MKKPRIRKKRLNDRSMKGKLTRLRIHNRVLRNWKKAAMLRIGYLKEDIAFSNKYARAFILVTMLEMIVILVLSNWYK